MSIQNKLARLGLKVRPWHRGDEIFALDIQGDTFFLQEGEGNKVHIQAVDRDLGQAILMVHELPRDFEVTIPKTAMGRRDRVVAELKYGQVRVVRQTPEAKRHLLIGRDERGHPFATQLQGSAISVKQAHEALKPEAVKGQRVGGKGKNFKKRGKKSGIKRQGEWFFVPTPDMQDILNSKKWSNLIHRKVPIEPFFDGSSARAFGSRVRQVRGNPHTASEVLVYTGDGNRRVYVRGAVRHAEHDTLKFRSWVLIERNNEAARPAGVMWVD